MTTGTHSLLMIRFDRRLSMRTVILVFAALACLLYAIYPRTAPPGPIGRDAEPDTMCLISRIGLSGLCR